MRSLDEIAGLRKTVKNTLGGVWQNCAPAKKAGPQGNQNTAQPYLAGERRRQIASRSGGAP
jgi:hypothetical protein